MEHINQLCSTVKCTGCGLCSNLCPVQAISMEQDNAFGHKRPLVNNERCIRCGICSRKCPAINPVSLRSPTRVYAAWQKDDEKHYSSSSGGIASALYEKYLQRDFWVAGVKYDKNQEPEFALTNNSELIAQFKKSKYVQPVTGGIYRNLRDKLSNGEKVLFIGMPCQCAAVKKSAETMNNGENLLLVDMVCHGFPSFSAFEKYFRYIEMKNGKKVFSVSFRDQMSGVGLTLSDDKGVFYKRRMKEDVFLTSFISGDMFADSCYQCRYACSNRLADMTICDFWGLGKEIPFLHSTKQVSAVLINTENGQKAFDAISDLLEYEERSLHEVVSGNDQLRFPSRIGRNRAELLEFYRKGRFCEGLTRFYGNEGNRKYRKRVFRETVRRILGRT